MEHKLHSGGQKDHLKALQEKYAILKKELNGNPKLTEKEKEIELKKMRKQFLKEEKESNQNLFNYQNLDSVKMVEIQTLSILQTLVI